MPRALPYLFGLLPLGLLALQCNTAPQPPPDTVMPGPGVMLGPDEIPLKVDKRCPGDPGCEDQGDGTLQVGFAKQDITPQVEPFTDQNGNGIWDPGEPYTDTNGNGKFDAYWIAGFGNGRLAYGVHDPVWARAVAIRQNKTTVVSVAVDTLGLFRDETIEVQKLLDPGLHISLLMVNSTHCHETADLTGGWGQTEVMWGIDEDYQKRVRLAIAAAATEAVKSLAPARVTVSSIAVEDGPMHDMTRYVSDTRDPVVINNRLYTFQFSTLDNAHTPLGTIINWAHHPESVGSDNHLISSDFVGYLRDTVEAGGGGMVVYISGALGGQIGPGRVVPLDDKGQPITMHGFDKARAIGTSVAKFALQAMADPGAKTVSGKDAHLSFRNTIYNVQVQNEKYHYAAILKVFRRSFCCYDPNRAFGDDNEPSIETQIAYLRLGPAAIITNPGELLPELFIGGYDGSDAGTYKFVDLTKPNAPDVSKAPKPPYLVDIMDGDRAYRQTWGLTMDFVGYIVPRYNWVLDKKAPYLMDAPGDHYEETNSIGPLAEPQIVGTMRQLILDGRPNQAR